MRYALSINYYTAIIITLLALASCGGKKGELRIKGEIKGMNNADLTIYSRDGVIQGIDTLHVRQGKIDWTCPFEKEGGSLTIVYPTYSTLTVFGSSGDVIEIEGDAKQLNSTKVSGNEENEAYTQLRLKLRETEKKDSLIQDFMNLYPESPVTRLLQLEEIASRKPSSLEKGESLPNFTLVTRKGDTITTDTLKGKYTLIAFWANWRGGVGAMNTRIRRLRRQAQMPLECLSYNMDVNKNILDYIERTDTITWHSFTNPLVFQSELASKMGIRDLPYFVLSDTTNLILATGKDWQKDIEPMLELITTKPEKEQEKEEEKKAKKNNSKKNS